VIWPSGASYEKAGMNMRGIGSAMRLGCWSVVIALSSLAIAHHPATAKTILVPAEQPTIQAGIDAANPGDEVVVAPGVYAGLGNKNLDLHKKDIVVRSESGAEVTTIDCQGSGRGFMLFGNYPASTRVEGFTIQDGNGNAEPIGGGGMVIGGGTPTIRRCIFRANVATSINFGGGGGGLVCHGSSGLIEDCDFLQNTVVPNTGAVGGGLASHDGRPTIRGCRFIENSTAGGGGGGGGLYAFWNGPPPAVLIEDCEFRGNQAPGEGGASILGGLVKNCRIEGNQATSGVGGIFLTVSTMEQCVIADNTSDLVGGGCGVYRSRVTDCQIMRNRAQWGGGVGDSGGSTIERCVIFDNEAELGGGLYIDSLEPSSLVRCTLVRNRAQEGSGVAVTAMEPTVHRLDASIVARGIGGSAIACFGGATMDMSCTDLFANEGGDFVGCVAEQEGKVGNFSADPSFCDEANDDFTLPKDSPCMPGFHPLGTDCGFIGALEQGCGVVAVEATTWGRIKARSLMRGRGF
jgi:hypothetical protein